MVLVSRCGDICPLGGVVAAQRPLWSQIKQANTRLKQFMTFAPRIVSIEYGEHVLGSRKRWSGPLFLAVFMFRYLSVGWDCCILEATTIAKEATKHMNGAIDDFGILNRGD